MQFDDDDLRFFAPPGTVTVSLAALEMAREFLATARGRTKADWIAVFYWAHTSVKAHPGAEPRDLGWLLGLGASKRSEVPGRAIHRSHGVEFAVQIPPEVLAQSKLRLIDVDRDAFFDVALR